MKVKPGHISIKKLLITLIASLIGLGIFIAAFRLTQFDAAAESPPLMGAEDQAQKKAADEDMGAGGNQNAPLKIQNDPIRTDTAQAARETPFPNPANEEGDQGSILPFTLPPAERGALLCLIFDDAGHNTTQLLPFLSLPFPHAVAVLPRLTHSRECAELVRASGKELMLHQPMQAKNPAVNPGAGAILPHTPPDQVQEIIEANLDEIGPVSGMNNHEGSLITENAVLVETILSTARDRGIYFVDSRTSAQSIAGREAGKQQLPFLERDIFLDNTPDESAILHELSRALSVANARGSAVIIGHVWSPQLARILNERYPSLIKAGYRFVNPTQLLAIRAARSREGIITEE